MELIEFADQTVVIARDQPQYNPMPAHVDIAGVVTCQWKLSWRERAKVLFSGRIWHQIHTFGSAIQPQRLDTNKPILGLHRWQPKK